MSKHRKQQRGYVMLTVLMIVLLLMSAAAFALRSADQEQRASARFRRAEVLFHAADAGAAQRLAEASLATDPAAVFDGTTSMTTGSWTTWPPNSSAAGADGNLLQFRTGEIRMLWAGKTPPPGLPVGTPTYIFEFTSYATYADAAAAIDSGEAAIRTGFKTWDSLPGNYAP